MFEDGIVARGSSFVELEPGVRVNTTLRNDGSLSKEEAQTLELATIYNWWLALKTVRDTPAKAVELAEETPDKAGLVCVWGEVTAFGITATLTLYSNTPPKIAAQTWMAHLRAIHDLKQELGVQQPATNGNGVNANGAQNGAGGGQPPAPQAGADGVIMGNRAPSTKNLQYEEGQMIGFAVKKIEVGTNNGSVVYKFWSPRWRKYPIINVYKLGTDGEPSPAWEQIRQPLEALNLGLEQPAVEGNWRIVTQVAHVEVNGEQREYFNPVRLEKL